MESKNLNEIMRSDPSLEGGKFVKVYERKCGADMIIDEESILRMVGQGVQEQEVLSFKILVQGREYLTPRASDLDRKEIASGTSFVQPFPDSNKMKVDAEQNPEVVRIEIMSDNDYFFQFVYE